MTNNIVSTKDIWKWVGLGWVGLVYNMLWVGLGLYFGGLGWVGFQKVDPCPCLIITSCDSKSWYRSQHVCLCVRVCVSGDTSCGVDHRISDCEYPGRVGLFRWVSKIWLATVEMQIQNLADM